MKRTVTAVEGLVAGLALAGLEGLCWQWPLLHDTTMRWDPGAPVLAAGGYGLLAALAGLAGRRGALAALVLASAGACAWVGDWDDAALRVLAAGIALVSRSPSS